MKLKSSFTLCLTSVALMASLVGCGNNNNGAMEPDNNTRPISHNYSNRNNDQNLNNNYQNYTNVNYHKDYDGDLAKKISKKVNDINNVNDAHVIIDQNDVIVGIDTSNNNKSKTDQEVKNVVQPMVPGKNVHVTTRDEVFNRIETIDNNLRDGGTYDEVRSDVNGIMNDIKKAGNNVGDAVKRPFENNY
ncbi:YhcN/YlaJ family sporulation lipoprotein [Bacillus sp. CRN 9]|nr:YhcN/YlaJ family sporulation lipoprotein [Bacillus sp. CRN 9]